MFFYLDSNSCSRGPFENAHIRKMLDDGTITLETQVAEGGGSVWMTLERYLENFKKKEEGMGSPCPDCQQGVVFGALCCPHCGRRFFPDKRTTWEYFVQCMKLYASFSGRATRAEYWSFQLYIILILMGIMLLAFLAALIEPYLALFVILILMLPFVLGTLIPGLAVLWRRLHDIGLSGTWYFISFIPYVGGIILFIMSLLDSKPGPNQYGPPTKYP